MRQTIIPADKKLRKKIILFLVLIAVALILSESYFKGYLERIEEESQKNPDLAFRKILFLFKLCVGVVSLLLVGMGGYLILLARRISKSGQYPPPGMKVIRETRIRTGDEAKSIRTLMVVSSVILIVFGFLFLYFPWALEKFLMEKRSAGIERNTGIERKVFAK
jgi:cytochrome bd-type quinol oxidase subunit 2